MFKNRALGIAEDEESDEEHSEDDITESEDSEEDDSQSAFGGTLPVTVTATLPPHIPQSTPVSNTSAKDTS